MRFEDAGVYNEATSFAITALPIVMVDFLEDNRAFVSHFKGLVNCMPFALKSETIGKLSVMTFYHLIGV